MAAYNRKNVEEFMNDIQGSSPFDIARIWEACAFRPQPPYRSDLARVIDKFYFLPLWEQQGVLFEMASLISAISNQVAQSRAQAARKTDPL